MNPRLLAVITLLSVTSLAGCLDDLPFASKLSGKPTELSDSIPFYNAFTATSYEPAVYTFQAPANQELVFQYQWTGESIAYACLTTQDPNATAPDVDLVCIHESQINSKTPRTITEVLDADTYYVVLSCQDEYAAECKGRLGIATSEVELEDVLHPDITTPPSKALGTRFPDEINTRPLRQYTFTIDEFTTTDFVIQYAGGGLIEACITDALGSNRIAEGARDPYCIQSTALDEGQENLIAMLEPGDYALAITCHGAECYYGVDFQTEDVQVPDGDISSSTSPSGYSGMALPLRHAVILEEGEEAWLALPVPEAEETRVALVSANWPGTVVPNDVSMCLMHDEYTAWSQEHDVSPCINENGHVYTAWQPETQRSLDVLELQSGWYSARFTCGAGSKCLAELHVLGDDRIGPGPFDSATSPGGHENHGVSGSLHESGSGEGRFAFTFGVSKETEFQASFTDNWEGGGIYDAIQFCLAYSTSSASMFLEHGQAYCLRDMNAGGDAEFTLQPGWYTYLVQTYGSGYDFTIDWSPVT